MGKRILFRVALVICLASLVFGGGEAKELVSNPTFKEAELPAGWSVWTPDWAKAACRVRKNPGGGLLVDGASDPYAVGGLVQDVSDVQGG